MANLMLPSLMQYATKIQLALNRLEFKERHKAVPDVGEA